MGQPSRSRHLRRLGLERLFDMDYDSAASGSFAGSSQVPPQGRGPPLTATAGFGQPRDSPHSRHRMSLSLPPQVRGGSENAAKRGVPLQLLPLPAISRVGVCSNQERHEASSADSSHFSVPRPLALPAQVGADVPEASVLQPQYVWTVEISTEKWQWGCQPLRISFKRQHQYMTWSQAAWLMQHAERKELREQLQAILSHRSPFAAFAIEFSPAQDGTEKFEFVIRQEDQSRGEQLTSSGPALLQRPTAQVNAPLVTSCRVDDATWVAPVYAVDRSTDDSYRHFASFVRSPTVPRALKQQLWIELGRVLSKRFRRAERMYWVSSDSSMQWPVLKIHSCDTHATWQPYHVGFQQDDHELQQLLTCQQMWSEQKMPN